MKKFNYGNEVKMRTIERIILLLAAIITIIVGIATIVNYPSIKCWLSKCETSQPNISNDESCTNNSCNIDAPKLSETGQDKAAPATAVVRQSAASKYNVGDKITFGSWPVGIEGEVSEAIEWEILEKKNDGTAIVLSSKVIDAKPYNTEFKDITWAESSLRTWLNGEFYSKAFTAKEKDAIVETTLKNADNIGEFTQEYVDYGNKWGLDWSEYLGIKWHTIGGVDTTDNVWLLSLDDMKRYGRRFSTDASRIGKPMEYLKKKWNFCTSEACKRNGAVGNAWWWLRSPGDFQNDAADVDKSGFVLADGDDVDIVNGGVRAALKINLNNL